MKLGARLDTTVCRRLGPARGSWAGDRRLTRSRSIDRVNRVGEETSPYLRQHADNPVDYKAGGSRFLLEL
jgi:hypothetical protein